MSYRNLEIWQLARELVIDIHQMSLTRLPLFELREKGSQIRRSIKSVKSNIVEEYGRRRYKQDFIRFIVYTHSSCDESTDYLETLFETGSFTDKKNFDMLQQKLMMLSRKVNNFCSALEKLHYSVKEGIENYSPISISYPESCILQPET